jgi:hypothetical protein
MPSIKAVKAGLGGAFNHQSPQAMERRSGERPWTPRSNQQSKPMNDFSVAAGSDVTEDWEEF